MYLEKYSHLSKIPYDFDIMKFWIFIIGAFGFIFSIHAQSVDSHHFEFSDTLETVGMEDALGISSELIQSENPFLFRASFDYARDSLSATNLVNNPLSIVDHMYSLTLGGSAVVHPRILVGITGSIHHVDLSTAYVSGQFDESSTKLGDTWVHAKIRLTSDQSRINVAFRPMLGVPTGSPQYLVSNDSFTFGGRFLMDTSFARWKLYFHTGMSYASGAEFLGLDQRKLMDAGLGVFYSIHSKFGVNVEWLQSISVWELENGQNPTQVNLGIRYDTGSAKVFVGGGVQGFDFSNGNRPYMFYAGVKQPFGAKRPLQPVATTSVVTIQEGVDPDLARVIELVTAMVVYFDNNSAKVKSGHHDMLNQAAELLNQNTGKIQYLVVHGHSDPRGNDAYNKRLSERRAQAVKKYLIDQGVNEHAILIDGYGESVLKTTEVKDYKTNRRVEFQVMKK
jgi:outer membrane protein OmpA-like peptidoglycan-associated protein